MSTANFFSNNDPNLPNLDLKGLPRIKKSLPKLEMTQDNLLFTFDDTSFGMDELADKIGNLYFNS